MRVIATKRAGRCIFYNHPCHDTAQGIIYILKYYWCTDSRNTFIKKKKNVVFKKVLRRRLSKLMSIDLLRLEPHSLHRLHNFNNFNNRTWFFQVLQGYSWFFMSAYLTSCSAPLLFYLNVVLTIHHYLLINDTS